VTRPNFVGGCTQQISGSAVSRLNGWFNTACFTQPGSFQFGNVGRTDSVIRAQGGDNWDMALFKNTQVTERIKLQFRAEIFNLANRVQFSAPGTVLGTSQFGVISAQRNQPRLIQFSLRTTF
jgi:hypothetical protein